MCEELEYSRDLHRAIESFKKLKNLSTHDPFLEVYSDNNRLVARVSEADFDLVIAAAEKIIFEHKPRIEP